MSKREREENQYENTDKRIKATEREIVFITRNIAKECRLIQERKKEIQSLQLVKQNLKPILDSYGIWNRVDPTTMLNLDILFLIVSSFTSYKDLVRMAGVSKKWRYMIFSFLPKLSNYAYIFEFYNTQSFMRFRGALRNPNWRILFKEIVLKYWKSTTIQIPKNQEIMVINFERDRKQIIINANGCKHIRISNIRFIPRFYGVHKLMYLVISDMVDWVNLQELLANMQQLTHIGFYMTNITSTTSMPKSIKYALFCSTIFMETYEQVCKNMKDITCFFFKCSFEVRQGVPKKKFSQNINKFQIYDIFGSMLLDAHRVLPVTYNYAVQKQKPVSTIWVYR